MGHSVLTHETHTIGNRDMRRSLGILQETGADFNGWVDFTGIVGIEAIQKQSK